MNLNVMDLQIALARIESEIGTAHLGLPEDIFQFVSRITPLINVDLLIQDEQKRTLLTWRDDEFYGAGWHVPGGIIRYKEKATDRIHACALNELGARVAVDPEPLLISELIREERTRGHFISLLYRCRLVSELDENRRTMTNPPRPGDWQWHEHCPPDLLSIQRQYARFFERGLSE